MAGTPLAESPRAAARSADPSSPEEETGLSFESNDASVNYVAFTAALLGELSEQAHAKDIGFLQMLARVGKRRCEDIFLGTISALISWFVVWSLNVDAGHADASSSLSFFGLWAVAQYSYVLSAQLYAVKYGSILRRGGNIFHLWAVAAALALSAMAFLMAFLLPSRTVACDLRIVCLTIVCITATRTLSFTCILWCTRPWRTGLFVPLKNVLANVLAWVFGCVALMTTDFAELFQGELEWIGTTVDIIAPPILGYALNRTIVVLAGTKAQSVEQLSFLLGFGFCASELISKTAAFRQGDCAKAALVIISHHCVELFVRPNERMVVAVKVALKRWLRHCGRQSDLSIESRQSIQDLLLVASMVVHDVRDSFEMCADIGAAVVAYTVGWMDAQHVVAALMAAFFIDLSIDVLGTLLEKFNGIEFAGRIRRPSTRIILVQAVFANMLMVLTCIFLHLHGNLLKGPRCL